MDILIVDQEMIRAGKMISSNMEEIVELDLRLHKVLQGLAQKGFVDQKISAALLEKADAISHVIREVNETTQDTMTEIQNYIAEIDRKDQYLY